MPSFNRILVLAILSLSVYVHSAPVREATGTSLDHAIVANEHNVVAPVDDFDEASDNLDARDIDVDFDLDDEEIELGEDIDFSALDNRGLQVRKAGAKPAPKPPKVTTPKPKTSKVTKPKTTKAAPPKATAKPAKTTKPAPPKSTKAAPPKTTAKPSKSTKAVSTAKASKTTKSTSTAKSTAKSCPVKKPTKKPAKKPRTLGARAHDYVAHLFQRDNPEFIGWHGTNSDTAAFWESKGQLEKPIKPNGVLDFIGLGPKNKVAGTSGADAEIGPGVYLTDDPEIAIAFANNNAKVNPGTTAQLCAIFAKSSGNWRNVIRKAFIPEDLVGDSSNTVKKAALEKARLDHIKAAIPGLSTATVVKFSLLDRQERTGQLSLPASITSLFTAKCFKADGGATAPGTSKFPEFSYDGETLRTEWNIASETGECA